MTSLLYVQNVRGGARSDLLLLGMRRTFGCLCACCLFVCLFVGEEMVLTRALLRGEAMQHPG